MAALTEPISFYKFEKVPDSFAGYNEVAALQENAPSFAIIEERSGDDVRISERLESEFIYRITINKRSDFTVTRAMYVSSRFGLLSLTGIRESERKRQQILTGNLIGQVNIESGTGVGGTGIKVYYRRGVDGATSFAITQGIGKDLIAFDRDGVGKEPVTDVASDVSKVLWDSATGTVSLSAGDIFFGNELLTFWLQ
jgi:hypothetical protein